MVAAQDGWDVRLRPQRAGDEQSVQAAQAAMKPDGFEFALGLTSSASWAGYLQQLAREHAGVSLPPDRVPSTFLIAEVAGELVGRTSIRHRLNDWLLAHGGHIGYGVLPGFRRRGLPLLDRLIPPDSVERWNTASASPHLGEILSANERAGARQFCVR